jgi:hypothetical protein
MFSAELKVEFFRAIGTASLPELRKQSQAFSAFSLIRKSVVLARAR